MGPSPDQPLNRRQVLGLGAAAVAAAVLVPDIGAAATRPAATGPDDVRPPIRPRADWAGDLGVTGELVPEDDVRFLLVHHTASTNGYGPDDVVDQIRGFYEFHTGPEKGWPDVAYNFFVDRFGGLWEGRQGSIDGPVRGDATGGSQGFALLCSLIGNFQEEPVPAEQQDGLVRLLAWLGESYAIDTSPGTLTTFVSRGSSRWPAGEDVTAATISGHRDMSKTGCPGDFAYPLLAEDIPARVSALRQISAPTTTASTTSTTSTTAASPSSTTSAAGATSTVGAMAEGGPASQEQAASRVESDSGDDDLTWPLVIGGAVLGAAAAAGGLFSRLWQRADTID